MGDAVQYECTWQEYVARFGHEEPRKVGAPAPPETEPQLSVVWPFGVAYALTMHGISDPWRGIRMGAVVVGPSLTALHRTLGDEDEGGFARAVYVNARIAVGRNGRIM